jgi:hypothetical protein
MLHSNLDDVYICRPQDKQNTMDMALPNTNSSLAEKIQVIATIVYMRRILNNEICTSYLIYLFIWKEE